MVSDQDEQSREHASDTVAHRFLFNVYQMEVGTVLGPAATFTMSGSHCLSAADCPHSLLNPIIPPDAIEKGELASLNCEPTIAHNSVAD